MAKIKLIRIRNIMGIEDLEITEPGKAVLLEGKNATGKSSVVEALKWMIEGGHDATLLRDGAEEGEGVILLDDDTRIRKRLTEEKSELTVKHGELGPLSATQTFVDKITDELADPVKFILSDDRVSMLLESLPLTMTAEQMHEALDGVPTDEVAVDALVREVEGKHALEAIETVHGKIYKARTGVNRVARQQRTAADQLRESLPAEGAEPDEVREELERAKEDYAQSDMEATELVEAIEESRTEKVDAIRTEKENRIEELRAEIQRVTEQAAEDVEKVNEEARAEKKEVQEKWGPQIQKTKDLVSRLEERLQTVQDAERTRERVQEAEATAAEHEARSEALTAALGRLDGMKVGLLDELPIEGAEIKDGELYVDGVIFDRVNSADKARIAFQLARQRAGDLPLVLLDDMEKLDTEHFEAVMKELENSDLHGIITRVSDDAELTIRRVGVESEQGG